MPGLKTTTYCQIMYTGMYINKTFIKNSLHPADHPFQSFQRSWKKTDLTLSLKISRNICKSFSPKYVGPLCKNRIWARTTTNHTGYTVGSGRGCQTRNEPTNHKWPVHRAPPPPTHGATWYHPRRYFRSQPHSVITACKQRQNIQTGQLRSKHKKMF